MHFVDSFRSLKVITISFDVEHLQGRILNGLMERIVNLSVLRHACMALQVFGLPAF